MSMADNDRQIPVHPGDHKIILLKRDVIPPFGFGRVIAPETLLATNEEADSLIQADGAEPIGDVIDNVTIEFPLDPIGGAGAVENDDNWGIGTDGIDAAQFWGRGVQGRGVRIGIADSGMDSTHPTFADLVANGRLVGFAHFDKQGQKVLQRRPDNSIIPDAEAVPTFGHWHGTHCAAVLVGQPTEGKMRGVAPDAELVVTRVLELANEGSVAGILAGLWWLTTQACDVVSLSLGWPGLHEEWAAPISALLDAGVVVIAAVGNEFNAAGVAKSRSPANYLSIPQDSNAGVLIPVGAHDRLGAVWDDSGGEIVDWSQVRVQQTNGTTRPSVFASIPPRIVPSMVAPGVDIISAAPLSKYLSSPGSSMATPHVAGLIALTLSELRARDPGALPRTAANLVLDSLRDLPPLGPDTRSGAGRIDNNILTEKIALAII